MQAINRRQLTAIHALLGKHHLGDQKKSIVSNFTGGRTESSRGMTMSEAKSLIAHLKSLDPIDSAPEKMRNKVLGFCHDMGWRIPGTERIDMERVNNWCCTRSYLMKRLDDYTYSELPKLVTQIESVYESFIKIRK